MTPTEELSADAKGKLEQKVIDFERLDEAGLRDSNWDVVFITFVPFFASQSTFSQFTNGSLHVRLGTSLKVAGSKANFSKIDKECVRDASFLGSLLTLSSCTQVCRQRSESRKDRQGPAIGVYFCMSLLSRHLDFAIICSRRSDRAPIAFNTSRWVPILTL